MIKTVSHLSSTSTKIIWIMMSLNDNRRRSLITLSIMAAFFGILLINFSTILTILVSKAGLLLYVLLFFVAQTKNKKRMRSILSALDQNPRTQEITFDEAGFDAITIGKNTNAQEYRAYGLVSSLVESDEWLFLALKGGGVIHIEKAAFASADDRDQVIQNLTATGARYCYRTRQSELAKGRSVTALLITGLALFLNGALQALWSNFVIDGLFLYAAMIATCSVSFVAFIIAVWLIVRARKLDKLRERQFPRKSS